MDNLTSGVLSFVGSLDPALAALRELLLFDLALLLLLQEADHTNQFGALSLHALPDRDEVITDQLTGLSVSGLSVSVPWGYARS